MRSIPAESIWTGSSVSLGFVSERTWFVFPPLFSVTVVGRHFCAAINVCPPLAFSRLFSWERSLCRHGDVHDFWSESVVGEMRAERSCEIF